MYRSVRKIDCNENGHRFFARNKRCSTDRELFLLGFGIEKKSRRKSISFREYPLCARCDRETWQYSQIGHVWFCDTMTSGKSLYREVRFLMVCGEVIGTKMFWKIFESKTRVFVDLITTALREPLHPAHNVRGTGVIFQLWISSKLHQKQCGCEYVWKI